MSNTQTLDAQLLVAAAQNHDRPATYADGKVNLRAKATLLRYESLMLETTNRVIAEHSSGIQTLNDLQLAIATYDEDYLLGQPISYLGLSALADELISKCSIFKVTPPRDWVKVSQLKLDWAKEVKTTDLKGY